MVVTHPEGNAMKATKLVTIAVVAMLLVGGAAAVGAASPADQAHSNATDEYENNASEVDSNANASEERADNATGVGPSDGLPASVPDHVSEIHSTIDEFLNGSIDNLGSAISELLSGIGENNPA